MSSLVWEHDVFLSFRGEDTRHNFTDHLYHTLIRKGIRTFRDAEELQKGNSVLPKLIEAIQQSRIAVIIFSTNYASSSWCLNELVHILECQRVSRLEVFPVFYHVEPSQVRKQTGVYGEALSAHEKDVNNNDKVDIWRNALTQVANLSGWDVKNRSEAEAIEEIAKKILNVLKDTFPTANNDLIGMDSRIEKVESCLDLSLDVVRTIGIWGMGGLGKTTLAQEVFKKIRENFDACAFVANVREKSGNVNGLVDLQKSLYKSLLHSDVDIHTVDMGKNLLRKGLRSKKVLIILDDVHKVKQMEALTGSSEQNQWLGLGSRVIITTRDEQLLKSCQAHKIYEVEKLTDAEASQLLCQKAFKKNNAPSDYLKLSNNFVKYAGGLPLALEVLGSYLCGKEVNQWSAALARLYENPEPDIFRVLQLSYDGLDNPTEKDMFLDIACFFRGEDQDRVMKIFTSCDFFPEIGIIDLINKSLIRIDEGKKLWMHDLLQQMAWQIVHQESPKTPGKRSRLWLNENAHEYKCRRSCLDEEESSKRRRLWLDKDALAVLLHNAGTEHVEGLFLSLQEKEKIHLNADPFYKMPNLRLLKIYNVNFSGCIEQISLSQNLRLLEWHEFPLHSLPSSFKPNLLVELKMPNSRIKQLWSETVSPDWLSLMDLSNCQYLTRTPDFSTVPKLERLILKGCKRLSEVHPTIGGLQHLVLLNLKGCESVESLPFSISLKSLKTLVLSGCLKLKGIPEITGNMENLSEIHLDGTAISELPISIQHLSGLILLNLRGCKKVVQSLPKFLPGSLKFIDARDCPMLTNFPKNCAIWTSENGGSFIDFGNSVKNVEDRINLKYIEDRIYQEEPFEIHFRHTRIPDWCGHSMRGSSVTIPLSDPEDGNSTWMGCVLFVVFEIRYNRNFDKSWELKDTSCHFHTHEGPLRNPLVFRNFRKFGIGTYVLCCYMPQRQFSGKLNKASHLLRASVSTERSDLKVKGCGIQLISQQGAAMAVARRVAAAGRVAAAVDDFKLLRIAVAAAPRVAAVVDDFAAALAHFAATRRAVVDDFADFAAAAAATAGGGGRAAALDDFAAALADFAADFAVVDANFAAADAHAAALAHFAADFAAVAARAATAALDDFKGLLPRAAVVTARRAAVAAAEYYFQDGSDDIDVAEFYHNGIQLGVNHTLISYIFFVNFIMWDHPILNSDKVDF
ncbi:hypothetical protein M0R45_032746 [Rubus argutus]|uniref:ADP-ribosyl cyclase/cyclic ADP-ribose hydrolase n=1 Tax=Rubus argutus TaxID=59490 RepID=A0AAW1WI08_RUBAR